MTNMLKETLFPTPRSVSLQDSPDVQVNGACGGEDGEETYDNLWQKTQSDIPLYAKVSEIGSTFCMSSISISKTAEKTQVVQSQKIHCRLEISNLSSSETGFMYIK